MILPQQFAHALPEIRQRIIVNNLLAFLKNNVPFFGKSLRRNFQILHPVCLQKHRQFQTAYVQLLMISGIVQTGKGIALSAVAAD